MTDQLRYMLNNLVGGTGDVIDQTPANQPRYTYPASLPAKENAQRVAVENRQKLYNTASAAKVGETCKCPSCVREFVKKSYQQKFCSNKGGGNCKDTYWNAVDPKRAGRGFIL